MRLMSQLSPNVVREGRTTVHCDQKKYFASFRSPRNPTCHEAAV